MASRQRRSQHSNRIELPVPFPFPFQLDAVLYHEATVLARFGLGFALRSFELGFNVRLLQSRRANVKSKEKDVETMVRTACILETDGWIEPQCIVLDVYVLGSLLIVDY
jgi:hypothetical protein